MQIFENQDFLGRVFERENFSEHKYIGCNFTGAQLLSCALVNAVFDGCDFTGAIISDGSAQGLQIKNGNVKDLRVAGINLNSVLTLVGDNYETINWIGTMAYGQPILKSPVNYTGGPYRFLITDWFIRVECNLFEVETWREFTDEHIATMGNKEPHDVVAIWNEHKDEVFALSATY